MCKKDSGNFFRSVVDLRHRGLYIFTKKPLKILALLSDAETIERLKNILMVMEQRMMLRGSAGELLRSAVTPFIQNMSEARFPCHQDAAIIDLWKMIIGKIIQRQKIVHTSYVIYQQ